MFPTDRCKITAPEKHFPPKMGKEDAEVFWTELALRIIGLILGAILTLIAPVLVLITEINEGWNSKSLPEVFVAPGSAIAATFGKWQGPRFDDNSEGAKALILVASIIYWMAWIMLVLLLIR